MEWSEKGGGEGILRGERERGENDPLEGFILMNVIREMDKTLVYSTYWNDTQEKGTGYEWTQLTHEKRLEE